MKETPTVAPKYTRDAMVKARTQLGITSKEVSKVDKKRLTELAEFITQGWPAFKNDRERIKYNTQRYKEATIAEAFESEYKVKLSVSPEVNETPKEVRVGEIIPVQITGISKDNVDYATNLKQTLFSRANLYKYEKFKHFLPTEPVQAKVLEVNKDKVIIDPLGGMMDSWLNPIIKNPALQKNMNKPQAIKIKNLHLVNGGFMGEAVIPTISEFVGEDYTVPAFIPGSQIVLNITDNFEQFEGTTGKCFFVLNYMMRPGTNQMSLICSRKEYLKFLGEKTLIEIFNHWCDDDKEWSEFAEKVYDGEVTGVINSSKKCGVFVEIPGLHVTGMVSVNPSELVNYKRHQQVKIKLTGFEEEMFYNANAQQMQHMEPYTIEDNCLQKCNLKPILQFV